MVSNKYVLSYDIKDRDIPFINNVAIEKATVQKMPRN